MSRNYRRTVVPVLVMLFLVVLMAGAPACAGQKSIDDASAEEIVTGMSEKAARGLVNIATGWLELPKQIYTTYQDHGALQGCLVGPFTGIGMTVARTVSGALEFATFYLAYPGFYGPYLEPGYVWEEIDR